MRWPRRAGASASLTAIVLSLNPVAAHAQAASPATIPALQEWTPGAGGFEVTAGVRIVPVHDELDEVAEVLAEDVEALTGSTLRIAAEDRSGDVILRLDPVDVPDDGYELRVTSGAVTIVAPTPTGVFLGTRTLLQLLAQDTTLPAGTARDWPRYPERGLMVDAGRKFVTADWIEQHIRELAFLKMNLLHLHLSDDQGFRIESETHPEIVSEQFLTKDEIRHLLAVAERYHVTVVPEIDMPGHMTQILASHPEYQLVDVFGQPNPTALDVTNPEARAFARELIEEYLELFPGPYWHGGADEYIHPLNQPLLPAEASYPTYPVLLAYAQDNHGPTANHKDAYLDFINWMNDLVRSHGRTLRTWADGLHGGSAVDVSTDIVVEWWQFQQVTASASELLAAGHRIFNAGWNPTYYSVAFYAEWTGQAKNELYWTDWEVHEFWGLEDAVTDGLTAPRDQVDPDEPDNLGSKVHVWYDEPDGESIETTAVGICPKLRLVAQKTWQSPTSASWDDFLATAASIGRSPGFTIDGPGACASPVTVSLAGGDAGPAPVADGPGQADLPATGAGAGAAGALVLAAMLARVGGRRRSPHSAHGGPR